MAIASFMNTPQVKQPRQQAMSASNNGASAPGQMRTMDMPKMNTNTYGGSSSSGSMVGGNVGPKPSGAINQPIWKPTTTPPNTVMPPSNATITTPPTTNKPPGPFNPTFPQPQQPATGNQGTAATTGANQFLDSINNAPDIWNPDTFEHPDNKYNHYLDAVMPLAQFNQNSYQYGMDFNEAQRRYNNDYALQQNQNQFQQQLSTQQQKMAEWQAQQAASQWAQQFGQTQLTDQWANEIARQQLALQGQEIGNTGAYQQGLISNQANLNNFQNQYWQGQNANQAQQNANQLRVGLDQNAATRDVANTYAGAQRYGADQQYYGQLYQSDRQLEGDKYQALMNLQGNQYQADRGLDVANVYGGAQKYGADTQLTGTKYQSDTERQVAQMQNQFLYQQLAQQAQQAEMERQNQLAMASMAAYGRSQAPVANWSRNWG